MFTLGDKLRVLNSDEVKIFDETNTLLPTTADVTLADFTLGGHLLIEGYGKFNFADLQSAVMHRARPVVLSSKDFTVVTPTGLVAGDAVQVSIRFTTDRYQSDLTNNYIQGGRPIVFTTPVLSTTTVAGVYAGIQAGWTAFKKLFNMKELPVELTFGGSPTFTAADATNTGSVNIDYIEITKVAQGIAYQNPITLAESNIVEGSQGLGQGKFLEESVRMATFANTNPYGIDTASTTVDIRGKYTQLSFTTKVERPEALSTTTAGKQALSTEQEFTVWLNESTLLGGDNAIERLAETLVEAKLANLITGDILFDETGAVVTTSAAFV